MFFQGASMFSCLGTQQKILKFYKWLPSEANKFQRWAICLYPYSKAILRMSLGICCLWYSNELILMSKWHALFQCIPPLNVASLRAMISKDGGENMKFSQTDTTWSHIKAIHALDCEKFSYASSGSLSIRNKLLFKSCCTVLEQCCKLQSHVACKSIRK